jgi:His-Xaa-Ser system protein HxsD
VIVRELRFDLASHSADAIQRAAYRLSDRLSIELATASDAYVCRVHLPETDEAEVDAILAELRNEVLDQVLRERIRTETEDVRNVILSLAFSNTSLVADE